MKIGDKSDVVCKLTGLSLSSKSLILTVPRRCSDLHLWFMYVLRVYLTSRCMIDAVCMYVCVCVFYIKDGCMFVFRCLQGPFLYMYIYGSSYVICLILKLNTA